MANSATQDQAIINAKADAAASGIGGGNTTGSRLNQVETVVSGTPFQPAGGRSCNLYIAVATAAALKIEMGQTQGSLFTVMPSQTAAIGLLSVDVPGGYWVKITGTPANFVATSVRV